MKRFIKKILAVIASLLIALAAIEAVLVFLDFEYLNNRIKNADNYFIMKPNSEFIINRKCLKNTVRTNRLGFYSRETTTVKPSGVFRIAVMGNSFVEAIHMPLDQTFFSILERRLNQLPDKKYQYEIMSFGMSSHATALNRIFAEKYAKRFSPDLIINAFAPVDVATDADYTDNVRPEIAATGVAAQFKRFIVSRSLAIQYLLKNYSILKEKLKTSDPVFLAEKNLDLRRGIHLNDYPNEVAAAWDKERDLMREFNDFSRTNGARFLIAFLPHDYMLAPESFAAFMAEAADPAEIGGADIDKPEKYLRQITEKLNIPFISALDYFRDQYRASGINPTWTCDGHYNKTGHEWLADVLYEYLKANRDFLNRP